MTPTAPEVRAMAVRLRRYRFTVIADMLDWLADQVWPQERPTEKEG